MSALPVCGADRLSDYVNPFIGATTNTQMARAEHGLGKTFPGAATPWGMTQVSPNTVTGGDNGSGYSYEHTTIEGFALTQMSGVGWYGDLGNFLVMPTTGPLRLVAGKEGKRSALPHSRVMIHQPLGGAQGQASDIEITAREIQKIKKELYTIIADHSHTPFEKVWADSDRDYWMTAQEAKEYGMVDEVLTKK